MCISVTLTRSRRICRRERFPVPLHVLIIHGPRHRFLSLICAHVYRRGSSENETTRNQIGGSGCERVPVFYLRHTITLFGIQAYLSLPRMGLQTDAIGSIARRIGLAYKFKRDISGGLVYFPSDFRWTRNEHLAKIY